MVTVPLKKAEELVESVPSLALVLAEKGMYTPLLANPE